VGGALSFGLALILELDLDGRSAAFAGADSDAVFEGKDEDLSVADPTLGASFGGLDDRFNRRVDVRIVDTDGDFELGDYAWSDGVSSDVLDLAVLLAVALDRLDGRR